MKVGIQQITHGVNAGAWRWLPLDATVRQEKGRDVGAIRQFEYAEFHPAKIVFQPCQAGVGRFPILGA